MSRKPPKNRSTRDRQVARAKARQSSRRQSDHPLFYLQPPFKAYREWINTPADSHEHFEFPVAVGAELSAGAKELADRIIKLAPLYKDKVPVAALYLDAQIEEGALNLAVNGDAQSYQPMPIGEMVSGTNNMDPAMVKEQYGIDLAEQGAGMSADTAGLYIHELHFHGYLLLDDDHIVNLVVHRPDRPGGVWVLNGHGEIRG